MADALQSIVAQAGLALAPLRAVKTADQGAALFRKLGYEIPAGAFGNALSGLSTEAGKLIDAVRQLTTASDEAGTAAATAGMFTHLLATVEAIRQLHDQLQANGGGAIPNIDELPRRLTDFLVLDFLDRQGPELHAALHLLGLIEHETNPVPGQPTRLINYERFAQIFTDPTRIANDVYRWETDFDFDKFLIRLDQMMRSATLPGGIYPQSDAARTALGNSSSTLRELRFPIFQKGLTAETYSQFGITFSPAEARGDQKKGFALLPYLIGAADFDFAVCDRGELIFQSTADIRGVGVIIRPPFAAEAILNVTGDLGASVQIREKPEKAQELVLFGTPGGTRLAAQGLGVKWFVQERQGTLDLGIEGEIQAVRLVIGGGDVDGFLEKILSGVHVQAEASAGFAMSLLSGFTFRGGAKLALEIPARISLGPVTIQALRIALAPANDRISLEAGADLTFDLGPVHAVVENIGLRNDLEFRHGNVGPVNLGIDFKPPSGAGIKIDSPFVTGGGFLSFDHDKGQYAGVLQLTIQDKLTVTAIGIITTRLPNGAKGFSFVVIITAQGFEPIQLGLGFTLTAIGGLLAINRTCNEEFLREGIKNNSLDNLLFPADPIRNAPQILGVLNNAFPPRLENYLFGPVVRICWGTPPILTMDLALVLEIGKRRRLIILGKVSAIMPSEKRDLLRLQMNTLGVIDFDQNTISLDAILFDSRLAGKFPITGQMAMRLSWGSAPMFALSIGGFHPAFKPPANFPVLERLAISFSNTSDFRLRAECYIAITSNTLQFGARIELLARAGGFSIEGRIGFDVLIQFDPFTFLAAFHASVQLKHGSHNLFKVKVEGELSGPRPLHVKGKATFEIFWCDFSVRFDRTLAEGERPARLALVNVTEQLVASLKDSRNWSGQLPESTRRLVTLREPQTVEEIVLHPLGTLGVKQNVVPLDLEISRFGNATPADARSFRISSFTIGGEEVGFDIVKDFFAPSQFFEMSDEEKLEAPSFELMDAGARAGIDGLTFSTNADDILEGPIEYETIIVDGQPKSEEPPAKPTQVTITSEFFARHVSLGAAARSLRNIRSAKYRPTVGKYALGAKGWTLVSTEDGSEQGTPAFAAGKVGSYAEAFGELQKLKATNPAKATTLMLVRTPAKAK